MYTVLYVDRKMFSKKKDKWKIETLSLRFVFSLLFFSEMKHQHGIQ